MKRPFYGEGKNTVLLQEEWKNVAEETNDDADVNAKANKFLDKNKDVVVTMKEERNTLKYQESINVDIKTLPVKNNHFGYQYMKLFIIHILK